MRMDYAIDGDVVWLTDISSCIVCSVCSRNLALNNHGTLLIKSFVTLFDTNNKLLTLKCGHCKHYNTIVLGKNNNKNEHCLLSI